MKTVKNMKTLSDDLNVDIESARRVLRTEIEGLEALTESLDDNFSQLIDKLESVKGRVIVSGMGKSGHIARKIAATLASTGTPAMFVHPGEASHGDLGMITLDDAVILLSNSGETAELNDIINYCKRFGIYLVGVVRRETSALVDTADIAFVLPEIQEASPVGAPTTSTTMMLAWGDALAVALLEHNGFTKEHFNVLHPGGRLGNRFIKVESLMKKGDELPVVDGEAPMSDVLPEMTAKSLGCALIVDGDGGLAGIITDGDLRRHMDEITDRTAADVMTENPRTINQDCLATEALGIMNQHSITSLCVVDDDKKLSGLLHIHDILRAGIS